MTGPRGRLFSKPQSHTPTSRQTASRSLAGQGMMCRNPKGMLEVSDTIARMRIWKHGCGDRRCRAASPQHSHFQRHTHTQSRPTQPFGAAASSVPKRQDRVTSVCCSTHSGTPSITARTLTLCYLCVGSVAETCASQPDALKS